MRRPFVWPWVSRLAYDEAVRRAECEHENAQALRRDVADLMGKYHALKEKGFAPADTAQPTMTPDVLGPLAQAALAEMGVGLPHSNRRAMETKARAFAVTHNDDATAMYVRRGDSLRLA